PLVLASLKSGALSPTSTAQAAPAKANAPASSRAKKNNPFWCFIDLPMYLFPFVNEKCCAQDFAIFLLRVLVTHRITRFARDNISGAILIPDALATFRLMTSSIFWFTSGGVT